MYFSLFVEDLTEQVLLRKGLNWENILRAMVVTSMFVRHAVDGNRSTSCVKAMFVGLIFAVDQIKGAPERLQGWVGFVFVFNEA